MPAEYESSLARAVAFADQFCSRSTVLRLALRRAQCNANNFTVPACHHAFGARLSNVDSPSSFFSFAHQEKILRIELFRVLACII